MIRDHLFPSTLKEAIDLKDRFENRAVFLAGGTDLFISIWERKTTSECLIDLTMIPELSQDEKIEGDDLILGACLTVDHISRSSLIGRWAPSLAVAASQLGSPALRNQATIGGNLVNSSPAADLVPPLIAQGAWIHTVSPSGPRSFLLEELSVDVNRTRLLADEILTHISVPILKENEGTVYLKLGLREASTISVAAVAIWLRRKEKKKEIETLRIAMGSVAPRVIRASEAEAYLAGRPFQKEVVESVAQLAARECKPISDIRASEEYRRSMIFELVKAGLSMAWADSSKGLKA